MKKNLVTMSLLLLAGTAAACGADFLLTYSMAPGVSLATATPEQMTIFRAHAEGLLKLQKSGVLYAAGRTTGPETTGIAIVKVPDEAAARAIIQNDAGVKAGLLKGRVDPFDLLGGAPPCTGARTQADKH